MCACGGGGRQSIVTVTLFCIRHYYETTYVWLTIQDSCWRGRRYTHTNTQTILSLVLHCTDWSILQLHWQECYRLPLAPGCHTAAASSTVWSSLCIRSLWVVQRSAGGPQTGCLQASGMEVEGEEEGEWKRRERGESERRQRSGEIWRWRERQSVVQMNRLPVSIDWKMDPFASFMLVKRSCFDGCSHAHTTDSSCQHKMECGSLLTNHCSSGSEWRQWLEGGGRVDEVERGTRETRHVVGQPLPPNIHTTCVPISTWMYVRVVGVLWAIQCDWQEPVLMCARSKKCNTL